MLNNITMDSIINKKFIAIESHTPLIQLYKILAATDANIFPVLTVAGELEGVIWIDEIRRQIYGGDTDDVTVADIMVTPPAIIQSSDTVSRVMDLFDKLDVWQLPVVDAGRFTGFVSKSALLSKYRQIIIKQHSDTDLFARD